MKRALSCLFFLFLLLLGAEVAEACKCMSSNSPCATFERADAVFVGTVKEITKSQNPSAVRVRLDVGEAFKGTSPRQEMVSNDGVCDFSFKEGETYLIYAHRDKPEGLLSVHLCSRTKVLKYAERELQFIRLIASGKPVSTIYGKVEQQTNKENPRSLPLEGVKLTFIAESLDRDGKTIVPNKKERYRETYTDVEGNYRFDDLPSGAYRLKVHLPEGLTTWRDEWEIGAKNPGCSEYNFSSQIDGRISGRILTYDGKPASRIDVFLYGTDYNPYLALPMAKTDADGYYELKGIPPGNYKLSTIRNDLDEAQGYPFNRYWFGETYDPSKAKLFGLDRAERLRDVNLTLYPKPSFKEVAIEVVWEDSVAANPVYFYYEASLGSSHTTGPRSFTDKEGKRILMVYSGLEYKLYARGRLYDGRYYESIPVVIKAEEMSGTLKWPIKWKK